MKSDFLLAITQLSAEKNLPKEVVLLAVETALVSAYRKDNFAANQNISVKINPTTGTVQVWAEKTVVENPLDRRCQTSLAEVRLIKPDAQIGDTLIVEATPHNAGRIAAQTAKQVILQRLHEAEHSAIFEEYSGKEGDIVSGVVQRIEPGQIFVDLGRTEAILPTAEQIASERYRIGQRLKVSILEVVRSSKGPRVIVSRSHPDLPRRLFETEVPEIFNGIVEIKSIAREAGSRTKVAVVTRQQGVDPVGCCVGLRGIRIQNIVKELNGEKIDVVLWSPDAATFIANALSPARILRVELDRRQGIATAIVPDKQLSLAIGKEGQNVRLGAKLTGWKIDIKSASEMEAERVEAAQAPVEEKEAEVALTGVEVAPEAPGVPEPALVSDEVAEPLPVLDTPLAPAPASLEAPTEATGFRLRFAEDIILPQPTKPEAKAKKKKKETYGKEKEEARISKKKLRREELLLDDLADDEK